MGAAIPIALGLAGLLGGRKKEDKVASWQLRRQAEQDRYAVQIAKARRRARANYANAAARAKGFDLPAVEVGDESVAEPNPGPAPRAKSGGVLDMLGGALRGWAEGAVTAGQLEAGRGGYYGNGSEGSTGADDIASLVAAPSPAGIDPAPDFPVDYSGIYLRPRLRRL